MSVIGFGESASGKTLVEKVALSLLPDDYIVVEKQVSPAALFNRAKTDPYFYDGKIVVYGDMGGDNDHENQQEAFDLMKELQSDGYLSKPVSVKDETNNWITEDLILHGNPCLWYTTVPTDIDSQELSRAIVFTPRTDNRSIFNKRGNKLSLKVGRTYNRYLEVKELSERVPFMVEHLRRVMVDVTIINPYFNVISEILMQSKYYKRDTEKYMNLLNTITALNYYNNTLHTLEDGSKVLITSRDDVWLFLSLLEPYKTSIAQNIKLKSAEIYTKLTSPFNDSKTFANYLKYDAHDEFQDGFSCRDYFENSDSDMSLRSIQRYMSELYQEGLLKIVGKNDTKANLYDIIQHDFKQTFDEIPYDEIADSLEYELGSEIADIIRNDTETEDLDIHEKHLDIGGVPW